MRSLMTVFLLMVLMAGVAVADGELMWRSHAEAMPEAAQQNKPVIIHFTADWCSWCTKMKKQTYTDPAVAEFMRDDFVLAMVNSDENQLLSMYYGVQSLPTIWILDSEGGGITKISGYRDAKAFVKYLEWVSTDAYHTQSFEQYVSSGS